MKSRKELVLEYMYRNSYGEEKEQTIFTTDMISEKLSLQRTYVSALLNELVREKEIEKIMGRPVKYRLHNELDTPYQEKSFFASLTGYDNTLKYPIQELKAALVYPKNTRHILICGEQGVGKSGFAHSAFAYAKDKKVLSLHAEQLLLNCYERLDQDLFRLPVEEGLKAKIEEVTIEHTELLRIDQLKNLLETIITEFQNIKLVIAVYTKKAGEDQKLDYIQKEFDFTIPIPSIQQYLLSERFHLVCECLHAQARQLNRPIKVDSVLLKCLLCYELPGNIGQLFHDIKKGCANGYSRVYHKGSEHDSLFLFIKDFPQYVRKGLLEYAKQSEEIFMLLGGEQSYVFDGYQTQKEHKVEQGKVKVSLTQSIEDNTSRLLNMGVSTEEISTMVGVDIVSWLQQYQDKVTYYVKQTPNFDKLIPEKLQNIVGTLLQTAGQQLSRVYLKATYDAICLFLLDTMKNKQQVSSIKEYMIEDVATQCRAEYLLAKETIQAIEQAFSKKLTKQDGYYLTLMLLNIDSLSHKTRKKPAILLVTHGVGTATSISQCIKELSHNQNVYGLDLDLEEELDTAYHQLKEMVLHIDNGKGILLIYDMGSIEHMGKMLMDEVDVSIKMIKVPLQLFLLEAAKKAEQIESVEKLQEEMFTCAHESFSMIESSYYRSKEKFTIIVLGRVGKSEAIQMKGYIEDHVNLRGITDIVPIISDDREQLLREVNLLRKESTILCIVGAYDPQLYQIRYLSFSKLLSIPTDKLVFLLYYTDIPLTDIPGYRKKIEQYVTEQFAISSMENYTPDIVRCLNGLAKHGVTMEEEPYAELLLYIAFTLMAGKRGTNKAFHRAKKNVLLHHKTLYNEIKAQLSPVEEKSELVFDDHDIANMISILSRK